MSWELVAEDVALHGAMDEAEARAVAEGVIGAVAVVVLDADRRELERVLPPWLGDVIGRERFAGNLEAGGLYRVVASRLGVDEPRAMELTKLTASAVTYRLDAGAARVLRSRLPESIAALFEDRPHELGVPILPERHEEPVPGGGHTLSSGRPEPRDKLSTSKPGGKHPVSTDD